MRLNKNDNILGALTKAQKYDPTQPKRPGCFGCLIGTLIMVLIYASMPGILVLICYLFDTNIFIGLSVGIIFDFFIFIFFQKKFKELGM